MTATAFRPDFDMDRRPFVLAHMTAGVALQTETIFEVAKVEHVQATSARRTGDRAAGEEAVRTTADELEHGA
jgi:hypothetical protein